MSTPPMKPARTLLPHEIPQMLHRSPSGAKRKNPAKKQVSRPSPFLSPSSSSSVTSSTSPTPTDDGNYRSLIDSGDYQSILPNYEPVFAPIPPPRLSVPFSTSMSSLEMSSSMMTSSIIPMTSSVHIGMTSAKPTVEVHPMPTEERMTSSSERNSSLNSSIDTDILKNKPKPAVPAKPKGLLIDHLNRSTSMTSLSSPVVHTSSAFLNTFVATPSLINLQQGYRNPELGSQELARLESSRHESIKKVSRNLTTYEEEKGFIESELEEIERTGARLLSIVERHDKNLAGKIRRHLENSRELRQVETKLRLQLAKIDEATRDDVIDKSVAAYEESRLRRRFQETEFLRNIYARREKDHERELSGLFNGEELQRWRRYKDAVAQLQYDDNTVDYRIRESIMKLDALNLAPRNV
ncbi:unnamed protein product [Caenorhabditis auriculariae]|uniref:ASD2 domain-containing protein n=1 Tax=Caenorhabditis auriculariae TaxID=2777116 RepID=A0A8S1HXU7_9PELO|nr:unnamed protein product [Caenorhabditis auriculariae]